MLRKILPVTFGLVLMLEAPLSAQMASTGYQLSNLRPAGGTGASSANYQIQGGALEETFENTSSSTLYALEPVPFGNGTGGTGSEGAVEVQGIVMNEVSADASITVIPEDEEGNPNFIPDPVPTSLAPSGSDLLLSAPNVTLVEGSNQVTAHVIDGVGHETFETIFITLDLTPPGKPGVFPVTSPTSLSTQVIQGAKDARTAIWMNGTEAVPLNAETEWSYEAPLSLEGSNVLLFTSKDEAGNESAETAVTIVRDTQAPNVVILSPADGATLNQPLATITGTIDDTAAVITTVPAAQGAVTIAQGLFVIEDVPLNPGLNNIILTASTGLTSTDLPFALHYDDQNPNPVPPLVDPVTTPTADSDIVFSGTRSDNTSFWINGTEIEAVTDDAPWTYSAGLAHGSQLFTFFTQDASGNPSSTVVISVMRDTTPPVRPLVTAFSLTPEEGTGLVSLHGEWSSLDPETAISEYHCGLGTTPTGADVLPLEPVANLGASPNATAIDKPGLSLVQGQNYYLVVKAINEVGLESMLGTSQSVFINRSEPQITSVDLENYAKIYHASSPVTVVAAASDADGDIVEYRFTLDNTVIQDWSLVSQNSFSFTSSGFGPHLLRVEARDAFNGLAFQSIHFFIIEEPPTP